MKKEKNKQRTRRLSIRLKLLIPSAILIYTLVCYHGLKQLYPNERRYGISWS